jgi:hypothetical protein
MFPALPDVEFPPEMKIPPELPLELTPVAIEMLPVLLAPEATAVDKVRFPLDAVASDAPVPVVNIIWPPLLTEEEPPTNVIFPPWPLALDPTANEIDPARDPLESPVVMLTFPENFEVVDPEPMVTVPDCAPDVEEAVNNEISPVTVLPSPLTNVSLPPTPEVEAPPEIET